MSSNLCLSSTNKPNSIQVSSPPLKPIQLKLEKDKEQEEENEEEEESSSSCSFSKEIVIVNSSSIEGETEQVKEEEEEEEDEGYHTPTSPRYRIPAAVECPPAPRKPISQRRLVKRKACCGIEITDVELMLFFVSEMDEGRRSKKAK